MSNDTMEAEHQKIPPTWLGSFLVAVIVTILPAAIFFLAYIWKAYPITSLEWRLVLITFLLQWAWCWKLSIMAS